MGNVFLFIVTCYATRFEVAVVSQLPWTKGSRKQTAVHVHKLSSADIANVMVLTVSISATAQTHGRPAVK